MRVERSSYTHWVKISLFEFMHVYTTVAQSGPEAYRTHVASGVGTSQEGEAMILLSYVRRLAQQPGVFWLVSDSEAALGALRTYQVGGHCGDGIHHLYATVVGGRHLSPTSAINVVTTPSH